MADRAVSVVRTPPERVDAECEVVVVGAGACGLTAALRAKAAGAEVLVLERDASPTGSTSLSSGFVPAAATRFQKAAGIDDDSPDLLKRDIERKTHRRAVPHLVDLACDRIGPALEWLAEAHGLEWIVLTDFLYPGHSRHRMHAVPEKTGSGLLARLLAAGEGIGLPIASNAHCDRLYLDEGDSVTAVGIARPDGGEEIVACKALVLACNGYGGNPDLVRRYIPEMADGLYHGHPGNRGDALLWGEALGAKLEHLGAYQGHGSLAHPQSILITWAVMMEGGIQVNRSGARFSNEHGGYSEQAVAVLDQADGLAWNLYDRRIHDFALDFPDYREALAAGAVRRADSLASLAEVTGLPEEGLAETLSLTRACHRGTARDPYGRGFSGKPPLEAPYYAVKVTGALFHTQGGLVIDERARMVGRDGRAFRNLFAGGGAACGVSGPEVSGYLSGNGLLTAIAFGFVAGESAAAQAKGSRAAS